MQNRKAFTMVELVFVIVVIGILTAVAIPKLAATRDDAEISKARATVASVRNAIATERQKRILRGDFTNIASVNAGGAMFDTFNADNNGAGTQNKVLEYPLQPCAAVGARSCWTAAGGGVYTYTLPDGRTVNFSLQDNAGNPTNRFDCTSAAALCNLLGA